MASTTFIIIVIVNIDPLSRLWILYKRDYWWVANAS